MSDFEARKLRIRASVRDRLEISGALQLDRDLDKAKTHDDLDRIEDALTESEAVADEYDLFDD
ncbi:MAG: hypothetical protein ACYSUI_19265 [Planctomycetota bacterium]|jgi:hypothetical protein